MRVGIGYDIHPLDPGRPLILGGVAIPGEPGLAGHSDADCLCHAVADALLGAAGLGDLGHHFPPGAPSTAGMSSLAILEGVRARLAAAGHRPVQLDATVVAERPRIAPLVPAMRRAIAGALGLDPGAVSVKATTSEGLGALGRGEGIACIAVATIIPDA